VNELNRNRWITQGIKIYTKTLGFLNRLNKYKSYMGATRLYQQIPSNIKKSNKRNQKERKGKI